MNPHQLITGALNRAESVFAIGSVEGIRFTACAVGCDIVILASDFQRVQIIPGASSGDVQIACIDACSETGKKLDYVWFETHKIPVGSPVSHLSFNLEGLRILVGSDDDLLLLQHASLSALYAGDIDARFDVGDLGVLPSNWDCVWRTKLSAPVRYMKFSPDGSLFATAGPEDTTVKLWYQDSPDCDCGPDVQFSFLYLNHPEAVQGFEFRRLPRYMPRHYVANALITWCRDHICRLWMETLFPSDGDIDFSADSQTESLKSRSPRKKGANNFRLSQARQKITHNLKRLKRLKHPKKHGKKSVSADVEPSPLSPVVDTSHSVSSGDTNNCVPTVVHFHLACSISAETDCFLVPSMASTSADTTFAIHWLNNKDFVFSVGAEKILTEALLAEQHSVDSEQPPPERQDSKSPTVGDTVSITTVIGQSSIDSSEIISHQQSTLTNVSVAESSTASSSAESTSKDLTDMKLEFLLREWYNSPDILFTIHPIDGSLLVWTVEWLDNAARQPAVSFSSRLPAAFPLTDATSLHHNLVTFNPHYPSYVEVLRRQTPSTSDSHGAESYSSIFLLTNHDNGSLNLWHLSVESQFSTILNISHISRMCGHRPTPADTPTSVSANFKHFNSELILWKVNPVGPLCKSGGVRELARINSPELFAFSNLAWIPAVLPSSTLGSVCNSPSSCFVATDGKCLRVYQAVLDARALLAELNYGKTKVAPVSSSDEGSSGMGSPVKTSSFTFPVCSTQSTSRPGCILQLAPISSDDVKDWRQIMFLHVFPESTVLGFRTAPQREPLAVDQFDEKFFVVLLEVTDNKTVILHMWLLELRSQPASPFKKSKIFEDEASSPEVDFGFYPTAPKQPPSAAQLYIRSKKVCTQKLDVFDATIEDACPSAGHLPTASLYPGYQAPYLIITSCSDEQVRFWKCTKDDEGKFVWTNWQMISGNKESSVELEGQILALNTAHSGRLACAYDPSGTWNSDLDTVDVEIAILECESTGGTEWNREDTLFLKNIQIPAGSNVLLKSADLDFNRPSSPVDEMIFDWQTHPEKHPGSALLPKIPSIPKFQTDFRQVVVDGNAVRSSSPRVVRIDFVATEDGSHILTEAQRKEDSEGHSVADIVSNEGLFEAARLASPMLPQYHPKQLMELLNAGKIRRVKAILLHVLKCIQERNVVATANLARHGSKMRRQTKTALDDEEGEGVARGRSTSLAGSKGLLGEEVTLDYEEIECIPPLPLHAIISADTETSTGGADGDSGVSEIGGIQEHQHYDQLFNGPIHEKDEDIDSALEMDDDEEPVRRRSRLQSVSDVAGGVNFSAKHSRILTRFLTHLHLPGLSSVDQMHLLAVADTLSSFSPDVMDKLAQANAAFATKTAGGVIESSAGGGYASVGSGAETVDECGLRYLMAMKQHEYLMRCLPLKQRATLRSKGLSSAHVTWALHSETETELLNSISCLQRGLPTWDELRSLGLGWWLKNVGTLRICFEKIAKAAFQQKNEPMDAAMFYLAMKKKNVLTHLFRSVRDNKMSEFFSQDFQQEKWKKAALKNAFVLMGKQRFSHAVGFFLLGGALSDAIQTCLNKLNDLQLALVIIRLYESEPDKQSERLKEVLCTQILGCLPEGIILEFRDKFSHGRAPLRGRRPRIIDALKLFMSGLGCARDSAHSPNRHE